MRSSTNGGCACWSTRSRPATWRPRAGSLVSLASRSTSGATWLSVTASRRSCPRRAGGRSWRTRRRQLADRLEDRGYVVSKTTVQKLLVHHDLGRRQQRVARAAGLAALVTGLVAEPVHDEVFGFCHWASQPGELIAVDSFYIGNLKGVGKLYQLTAIDTATRWAMIQ